MLGLGADLPVGLRYGFLPGFENAFPDGLPDAVLVGLPSLLSGLLVSAVLVLAKGLLPNCFADALLRFGLASSRAPRPFLSLVSLESLVSLASRSLDGPRLSRFSGGRFGPSLERSQLLPRSSSRRGLPLAFPACFPLENPLGFPLGFPLENPPGLAPDLRG